MNLNLGARKHFKRISGHGYVETGEDWHTQSAVHFYRNEADKCEVCRHLSDSIEDYSLLDEC